MMFTPFEPRAGPTGGAGVALPASNASLTTATTEMKVTESRPGYQNPSATKSQGSGQSFSPFFGLPDGLGGAMATTRSGCLPGVATTFELVTSCAACIRILAQDDIE